MSQPSESAADQPEPTGVLPKSIPPMPAEFSAAVEPTGSPSSSHRRKIGSQRPRQPAAAAPVPPPAPVAPRPNPTAKKPVSLPAPRAEKVVLPNIRERLSPDLEAEFAAALGEGGVDDLLMSSAPKAAGEELALESRVSGKVLRIHRDQAFLDLGGRRQGVLSLREVQPIPEIGAQLDVIVSRFDATEGLYEVVLPGGAVAVEDWSEVSEGLVVEARITGHNKGGLECEVGHLRGFIPAGQASLYRIEDLSQLVGQRLRCVVTQANPQRRNLVLSHRAVLEREQAEAKQNMLAQIEVGQTYEGVVRSLQDFGAFVDLGGLDGLIHISQLSWERIKHPSEVLEVGQKVKVRVQKFDSATGRISLAFRDLSESPWERVASKYPIRSTASGVVSRIMEFGAFVKLEPGVEGLIHISEISHKRVFRISDVLQEGQAVEVAVLAVDPEQQRMSLSMKALESRPEPAKKEEELPEEPETPLPVRPASKTPLKGGLGRGSTGEAFGLKW